MKNETPNTKHQKPKTKTHFRTCNLCEALCGLEIQLEDGKITSIKGDKNDPFSKGHICPKAVALQDIYADPDRLKQPVRRTMDGWETISWEEAFEELTSNIKNIQEKYGKDAVGIYQGNPNVHNTGTMLTGRDFVRALHTKNRFSATSADQLPHHFASLLMFGHYFLLPIPDVDHTDFMLILGANPLVSNGSLMTAPGMAHRLKAIQKREGKFVVIDPRKTETAAKADQHFFIHPGMDVLLLLALTHTIFEENLVDLKAVADCTDGLELVRETVKDFSPESLEKRIGISAEEMRQLARDFANAPSACCYGRLGVSTQAFGGLAQWLVNVLNIITGNFDRKGGVLFTKPAVDIVAQGAKGRMGRWKSRERGLPEFGGELPVAALASEITTEGDRQIKAMITVAGNPVLSTPNGGQLDKAFEQLEFVAAIDIYINETTRHANLILPPTTGLETLQYDLVFNVLAVRNVSKLSLPLFEKTAEQKHDYEIFSALTSKLTGNPPNAMTPEFMLDFALQTGPYASEGLNLKKLKEQPHGIDLGPLEPSLPNRLFTPKKRIQLAPEAIIQDLQRVRENLLEKNALNTAFPLALIGRRSLRSNNSWMHNSHRLVKGREACTLLIHPEDAQEVGLENGAMAVVTSRVGSVNILVETSEEMMPGVVSIPHGWGHNKKGSKMAVAEAHAGVSINDLTDDLLVDELTGNAAFCGTPVKVEKIND